MISAIVLTYNNQDSISRCLRSLKWCDEIIVIDDYSDDKTVEEAAGFGARVFKRHLNGDFAAQRNFGLQKAKGEWIFFVDSDEKVSKLLAEEIQRVVNCCLDVNGFFVKREDYFLGKRLRFGETAYVRLVRLARKNSGKWHRPVHEVWEIDGSLGKLNQPIFHYAHKSISDFLIAIDRYTDIEARYRYKAGALFMNVLMELIVFPPVKFAYNYFFRFGLLDGFSGFVMALMMGWHSLLVRVKLCLLIKKV